MHFWIYCVYNSIIFSFICLLVNPVIGYDPNGTWDWCVFASIFSGIVYAVLAIVVGVLIATGVGAPLSSVLVGAGIGGLIGGLGNNVSQAMNVGWSNINWSQVAFNGYGGINVISFGGVASSFVSSFKIRSIKKIGKIDDYYGIKFTQTAKSGTIRVRTFSLHPPHNGHPWHWQLNSINPRNVLIGKKIRWDLLLRRL